MSRKPEVETQMKQIQIREVANGFIVDDVSGQYIGSAINSKQVYVFNSSAMLAKFLYDYLLKPPVDASTDTNYAEG